MSNLVLALQITLFGMFLIFVAMVLLWALLALMVFILARVQTSKTEEIEGTDENSEEEQMRQQAVAVAVSAALHQRTIAGPGRFPLPPTAFVSAWQAVLRSHILNKRGVAR